ncbi:MAG: carbohydrate binding family 9 domain-containing protein [Cyclobacteriaceae bacterium]|nr:carbohydrate binding family 9 domain-containing protein [Cyclobacteriaceae bacterium]
MSKLLFFLFLSIPFYAFANGDESLQPVITEKEPLLDGILDDPIWADALQVTGFKTSRPDYGKEMDYKTVVYITYDQDNLYFAFKCYDDPNLVKTSISARDRIEQDDWISINLDSFNDKQTLYGFYINPNGIQMDTRVAGRRDDPGIDFIWYTAGKIDEEGYSVEVKIPFKSIRYASKNNKVTMGVLFNRNISRSSTQGTFPELDPNMGYNIAPQTKAIEFTGVRKSTLIEVLPAVTYSKNASTEEGNFIKHPGRPEFGITGKWGITSDLVLDLTYNPDYSQVESDVTQVDDNQRFALFYPERRPFFQEGSENFNFAGVSFREGLRAIVNTRTIVNPQVAGKLSGKLGDKNRISLIYARDELDYDSIDNDPFGDVMVGRYRRSLWKDSYVGGIYTARAQTGGLNQVAGGDGLFRLSKSSVVTAHFLQTVEDDTVGNVPGTIIENREKDHSMALEYSYDTRQFRFRTRVYDFSENFNTDVGYVGRVGVTKLNLFFNPRFYIDNKYLQRIDNWTSLYQTYDKPSGLWEKDYFFNLRSQWIRNTEISVGLGWSDEIYRNIKFNTNNIRLEIQSQMTKRINLQYEHSYGNLIRYLDEDEGDPFSGYGQKISGEVSWQASDKINTQWRLTISDFYRHSDRELEFRRALIRSRNTYQMNKYFFLRIIAEYDSRDPDIRVDYLASFTFIPGTVVHIGYGSLFNKLEWDPVMEDYVSNRDRYKTFNRGVFFKASYLWRK